MLLSCVMAEAAPKSSPYRTDDGKYILSPGTTLTHFAIIEYVKGADGLFQQRKNVNRWETVEVVPAMIYAYCPKTAQLLYCTSMGNYSATVNKDFAKLLKKDKSIPKLKPEEMDKPLMTINQRITYDHNRLNAARSQQIADSIQLEKKKQEEAEALRRQQEEQQRIADYRQAHAKDWRILTLSKSYPYPFCGGCDKSHEVKTFRLLYITPTHWIYTQPSDELPIIHMMKPEKLSDDSQYKFDIFSDSIQAITLSEKESKNYTSEIIQAYNTNIYDEEIDKIKKELHKKLPWGYVSDFGWDNEYGMVTFEATFNNTSDKKIKYIAFHFSIYNAVDDLRCSGVFKGTGPVEPWENGRWEWDSSHYWAAGDASYMRITKVVLTYMNGTTKVLTGKHLYISSSDD